MQPTPAEQLKILWNKFLGDKTTTGDLSFDEESIKSLDNNLFNNIWVDDIPEENPISNHTSYPDGTEYPISEEAKIIKKYHKYPLVPVKANPSNKSFKGDSNFKDIIRSEYGTGKYQWELWKKDSSGNYTQKVAFGLKAWYFDADAGVLYFPNGFPDGINNTNLLPAITCYKYVGRKGSSSLVLDGTGNDVQVDNKSIYYNGGKLAIKGIYRTVGYSANTLNSNANLSSNSFTITHNLGTTYVSVATYETTGNRERVYFDEKILSNNTIKIESTSNVRAGDYQITIIGTVS